MSTRINPYALGILQKKKNSGYSYEDPYTDMYLLCIRDFNGILRDFLPGIFYGIFYGILKV